MTSRLSYISEVEVVIPAYNEEKRIARTLSALIVLPFVNKVRVVFEGNDRTPLIARQFEKVEVFEASQRLGKGGAIKKGLELTSRGTRIILIDADLPVKPEYLRDLVYLDADLVITVRKFKNQSFARKFLHHSFKLLTKLFFPSLVTIRDFQSGAKVLDSDKGKEVLPELIINDYLIDVNLIYAFKKRGYKIAQVEVEYENDEAGSKISSRLLKVTVLMFLSLIKLRVFYSPFKGILRTKFYRSLEARILRALTR
ncbi:MAG: glycosyltransferase [Thermoprotei archaeon]